MIALGKWRRGDEPLARVRVEYLLTRDDLAGLLISALQPDTYDDLRDLTPVETEKAVRQALEAATEPTEPTEAEYTVVQEGD